MDDEARRQLIERAVAGELMESLAAEFGVTRQAVRGLLRRRGIPPRTVGKLSDEQRREVVSRYQSGLTLRDIAQMYKVTEPAVRGLLVRRGVAIRRTEYTLAHDAFDILDSEAMYWAGFLFADGSVHARPGQVLQVSVALAERDRDHLVALRSFLGSTHAVCSQGINRAAVQYSVRSQQIGKRLLALGRYSNDIHPDLVSSRDFWRGVCDGDGSVGTYRRKPSNRLQPQFRLVGRHVLLQSFLCFLWNNGIVRLTVRPHKSIFTVGTTGRPAVEIIRLLYADATVALARKARTAQAILDGRPEGATTVDEGSGAVVPPDEDDRT